MATIKVIGMRCGHCVGAVTKALEDIDGIGNVKVDLEKAEATYEETGQVSTETIEEEIKKIGFELG
ncbi:MAG: heavy metal-associated domain-containing protein [Desulfurivibrionaceae bacterium]|nr:heavy metal-associated domain-containing protein [Desulfobulbales bacterium]MDT8334342.1 heavy metal-associated domain-containing protein [Desulfurivibrionaceae bacterium]